MLIHCKSFAEILLFVQTECQIAVCFHVPHPLCASFHEDRGFKLVDLLGEFWRKLFLSSKASIVFGRQIFSQLGGNTDWSVLTYHAVVTEFSTSFKRRSSDKLCGFEVRL